MIELENPVPEYPGIEPRAWWSPTKGYFLLRWCRIGDQVKTWVVNWADPMTEATLPEDAAEFGASPTPWAYRQASNAAAKHARRATNLEGRLLAIRDKIAFALGIPTASATTPAPEVMVDTALHAVLSSAGAARAPKSFDAAYARLSEIAGPLGEGETSTWSLVQRALEKAHLRADLHRQVVELAEAVRVDLPQAQREPSWLS